MDYDVLIPESKMTLYGYAVNVFMIRFFETMDELEIFLKEENMILEHYYILEYLGDMAGHEDVIRVTIRFKFGGEEQVKYYTPTHTEHYGVYNHERSIYCGRHVWEAQDGNYLKDFFDALKEHGLKMKHDYWAEEAALIDSMIEYARESGLNC